MKKKEILTHWQGLKDNVKINMAQVPYKHHGSTYAEDGIRLTGSKQFIDSVLANLKELLEYENCYTRLSLNYQESKDRETGRPTGSYNCYIQVHERGSQAKAVNAGVSAMLGKQTLVSAGY